MRPPSSAGWNEPPHSFSSASLFFYFSPNSLCLLSSFFVVACIIYPERRCKVVGPSSFLAVLIIRGTLAQLTDNKQWQEVVDAIAFLFSAFLPPLGVSLPTEELSLVFFLFTFFFLSLFQHSYDKVFLFFKNKQNNNKKGRFEKRKSANNLTACEERKNNISEVLTSAKSFTVGESKKQTTDGFPAGS